MFMHSCHFLFDIFTLKLSMLCIYFKEIYGHASKLRTAIYKIVSLNYCCESDQKLWIYRLNRCQCNGLGLYIATTSALYHANKYK